MLFECDFGLSYRRQSEFCERGGGETRSPPTVKISRKASSSNFPMRSRANFFWAPRSRRNRGEQSGAVCGAPWNINDVALLQFTREHLFSNYTLALSTAVGSPLNQELNVSRKLLFMLNIYVQALYLEFLVRKDKIFTRSRLACDYWQLFIGIG